MTGLIHYNPPVLQGLTGEVQSLVSSAKGIIEDLRQGDTALSNSWQGQSSDARHALSQKTKESLDQNTLSLDSFGKVVEEVVSTIMGTDSKLTSNYAM